MNFSSIEPHCLLPTKHRDALQSACARVLQRPTYFAQAATWLHEHYSEAAQQAYLLDEARRSYKVRLLDLRDGINICDTFPRRKALRHGTPRDDLVRDTVKTARYRGWRIVGNRITTRVERNQQTEQTEQVERAIRTEADVELVWAKKDQQTRETIQRLKTEYADACRQAKRDAAWKPQRLNRAIRDVLETGLPAGQGTQTHAARAVLLAAVLAYPADLPLPGEFCTWPWANEGSLFFTPYKPGRVSILFPFHELKMAGPATNSSQIEFDSFIDLVRRAIRVLPKIEDAATPAAEKPAEAVKLRGRLSRNESGSKRTLLLATIRQHPSLKDDPKQLASIVRVSESTVRRWLKQEENKYAASRVARPDEDE